MHDLMTLGDAERAFLGERLRSGVCVVYDDQELPPGSRPARGRVGVEEHPDGVALHVQRGVAYDGHDATVRQWIGSGSRTFPSLDHLGEWLRSFTAMREPAAVVPAARPTGAAPQDLTSLDEVAAPETAPVRAEDLHALLAERVVGHGDVLRAVADGAARHATKPFPRRPWSVVLLGPTGVGKTSVATALGEALDGLGDGWRTLRLDMSELAERHSVARLVGAPPGYVGYGDRSLATALAENPRHVVLFDEIEKAHPEVLLALMNLIDAGRLDSATRGRVPAERAVLVFTSNVTVPVEPDAGPTLDDGDRRGRRALVEHGFPREVVGRFGLVATMRDLSGTDLAAAAAMAVARVAADYGREVVDVEPAYLSGLLAEVDRDGLGIRGLEHVVDRQLGAALPTADRRVRVVAAPPYVEGVPTPPGPGHDPAPPIDTDPPKED